MLLRSLINIFCQLQLQMLLRLNEYFMHNQYPVSGMTNIQIYQNDINTIPQYHYIPVYRPPLVYTQRTVMADHHFKVIMHTDSHLSLQSNNSCPLLF